MSGSTDALLLAAAALAVAAPLVAAAAASLGVRRPSPRGLAVKAAVVSLLASLAITLVWSRSDGTPVAFGDRLGGGAVVFIDGITAVLLPYVAVANQRTISSSGCVVRNTALVAAAPNSMRLTAAGSSERRGATSRMASSTTAT
ncbi:MAG: hypothetical protein ACKOHK_10700 [Planctomycetia bacterium]